MILEKFYIMLENTKEYNKKSFIVILQFINYLLQESFVPTFRFINHIVGLRFLIIKFKEKNLAIDDDYIDMDEENGSFLTKYLINVTRSDQP